MSSSELGGCRWVWICKIGPVDDSALFVRISQVPLSQLQLVQNAVHLLTNTK